MMQTPFSAIYSLVLRTQATRSRLIGLGLLGGLAVFVGLMIGISDPINPTEAGTEFVNGFGLSLLAPVTALVLASAALGDPVDDESLVYLWLPPVPRPTIAIAAAAASLTVVGPMVIVPMAIAAVLTGGGSELLVGTVVSLAIGLTAYTAIFVALGLRTKRSLVWGILYILIWEGFIANAGSGSARFAVRAYTRSILAKTTDINLELGNVSPVVAVIVPIAVAAAAVFYTIRRLERMDVA